MIQLSERIKIPTGSKNLDELFRYQFGVLHAFYGIESVGKTTLASYLPIVQVTKFFLKTEKKLPDKAVFVVIDTEGGFDFERLEQIADANGIDFELINKHLIYVNPQDFDSQHKYVTKDLDKDIEGKIPLVVALDSAVAIYRGIITRTDSRYLANTIRQYAGKIDLQLQRLRYMAREKKAIATVVTWHQSEVGEALSGIPSDRPFIGGSGMGYLPKTIVGIHKFYYVQGKRIMEHPNLRVVYLWKHRSKPRGLKTIIKLCNMGVCDPEEVPEGGGLKSDLITQVTKK